MTLALPSERNDATRGARLQRLTRAQRTAVLKALADPKRFELLEKIARANCPLGCAAAHEALAISPATLSHHIKELQTSGLIDVRREGKFAFPYRQARCSRSALSLFAVAQPRLLPDPLSPFSRIFTILLNPFPSPHINSIVVETSKRRTAGNKILEDQRNEQT